MLTCFKPKNIIRFLSISPFSCFFFTFILFILVLYYYNKFFCILYAYFKIINITKDKNNSEKAEFEAYFIL